MNDFQENNFNPPVSESSNLSSSESSASTVGAQPTDDQTPTPIHTPNGATTPPPPPLPQIKPRKSINPILAILIIIVVSLGISALVYWQFFYEKPEIIQPATQQEPTTTPTPAKQSDITIASNIVEANNQFALDYYAVLKNKAGGNIFCSPFSISSALAMTYEGAKGQTAQEIASVFHFPEDIQTLRTEYQNIYSEINKTDKAYELKTANALWAQKDYPFLQNYLGTIEQYYNGKTTNLDFASDTENSRLTINGWVEDQTNDKIKDLIPQGVLDPLTRLVLTNAVYFKGEWVKQFNKEDTIKNYRFNTGFRTVEVDMMNRTDDESEFNYTENDQLQVLELPYSGEDLSMLILLPKNNDLPSLENSLSTEKLSDWKQNLENQRVDVYIPKFKFETKYMMSEDLGKMGMPTAFGGGADFSGMDGTQNLYIGSVIHQAFVEVNEEGTEAAAATAVVMFDLAAPPETPTIPTFMADHPFIFLIQDNATGNILFIGRVINPSQND